MKILVPTDFSDNALKAALYAAELAKKSGSEIVLFNVLETMGIPFDEVAESKMQETRKIKLQDVKASILSVYKNLNVQQELEEGTVIESILQFAAKEKVDLIIMGNKGAGVLFVEMREGKRGVQILNAEQIR
ncbi:MAG: universal stress protein, partial [Sphingobacteriales bacterium]